MATNDEKEREGSKVHIPVMLKEAISLLNIKDGGTFVDCTLGLAGHSSEILKKLVDAGYGQLICIDRDTASIKIAREKLLAIDPQNAHFQIVHDKFSNFQEIMDNIPHTQINGVLFDLGVSSPQYDDPWRGFTYRLDVPLDMRMDQTTGYTAADIVNKANPIVLGRYFITLGDEKYGEDIAFEIMRHVMNEGEIHTTGELEEIVKSCLPKKELYKRKHPAQKVFQTLRILVNDEYGEIRKGLKAALDNLAVGGRIVVITFNNDEDRIVKRLLKDYTDAPGDRLNLYIKPEDIKGPEFKFVRKKPIYPSDEEIARNPRARSSKLRVVERIKEKER